MSFHPVQSQPFTLYGSGAIAGATTIILTSFNQINGTQLTMANFGSIGFFTLEPGNGTLEEAGTFTGVTPNSNGTVTLTGVSTQLTVSPYTQTSGLAQAHAGGVYLVLSNTAGFYNEFPTIPDNATISGVYTFTAPFYPQIDNPNSPPTTDGQFAPKKYVDDAITGLVGTATTTSFGTVKVTVAPLVAGNPIAVENNDTSQVGSGSKVVRGTLGVIAASWGGTASSVATLGTDTLVVQNPHNATATATAAKIPIADANGELNTWLNQNRLNVQTYVAGENIDASASPRAVYLKESDGRVYKLDATNPTEAAFAFIGFAIVQSAITTGNSILIQTDGKVSGFTGLTIGGYYYGTNTAGNISLTAGTESLQVGRAVTATTLFIQVGKKVNSGNAIFSATATSGIVVGFRPSRIRTNCIASATVTFSNGGWTPNSGNQCVYIDVGTPGTATADGSNAWHTKDGANTMTGTITTITSSGFTLENIKTNSAENIVVFYEVEG